MAQYLWVCGCLLILAITIGCQQSADGRLAISGEVTLDGKPLKEGYIRFTPQGAGTSASGIISDGKYSLVASKGVARGQYRVVITSEVETGREFPDPDSPDTMMMKETRSIIPVRYNSQSELELNVQEAPVTANFDLTSK